MIDRRQLAVVVCTFDAVVMHELDDSMGRHFAANKNTYHWHVFFKISIETSENVFDWGFSIDIGILHFTVDTHTTFYVLQ